MEWLKNVSVCKLLTSTVCLTRTTNDRLESGFEALSGAEPAMVEEVLGLVYKRPGIPCMIQAFRSDSQDCWIDGFIIAIINRY